MSDLERAALHKVIDELKAIVAAQDEQLEKAIALSRRAIDRLKAATEGATID